jgi:hypothetical protein
MDSTEYVPPEEGYRIQSTKDWTMYNIQKHLGAGFRPLLKLTIMDGFKGSIRLV